MDGPTVVEDLRRLPQGSHCLSFHASEEEAAQHAVAFLAGTEDGTDARYWVADERLRAYYDHWLSVESPARVGCVAVLATEQVEPDPAGRLRPVPEVREFVQGHPDGVTAGGDTLSRYWSTQNVPAHLEYEGWFQRQPIDRSRFLCPYDLRRVPPDVLPGVLRGLGRVHTHVALSRSPEPSVRLLQLFAFPRTEAIPEVLDADLGWAVRRGLVRSAGPGVELELTAAGDSLVKEWSAHAILDW